MGYWRKIDESDLTSSCTLCQIDEIKQTQTWFPSEGNGDNPCRNYCDSSIKCSSHGSCDNLGNCDCDKEKKN